MRRNLFVIPMTIPAEIFRRVAYDNGGGTKIEELHDSGIVHDSCLTKLVEIVNGTLYVVIETSENKRMSERTLEKELSELGLK